MSSRVLFWTFRKQYWWTFSGVLRPEKSEQIKAERCHTKKNRKDISEGEWNLSHRGMGYSPGNVNTGPNCDLTDNRRGERASEQAQQLILNDQSQKAIGHGGSGRTKHVET